MNYLAGCLYTLWLTLPTEATRLSLLAPRHTYLAWSRT